jgi:SAM-dependent methyltransferase
MDRTIAPGDTMYTSDDHYFSVGASALRAMLLALETVGLKEPRRILDFGCGYGRVLRLLRAAFPHAELLACDVDVEAMTHCAQAFGARAVAGSTDFDRVERLHGIDLIWCGSVLTHLPAPQWQRLLAYFAEVLADGGVAVVTTAGRSTAGLLEQGPAFGVEAYERAAMVASYKSSGLGYSDAPGHVDYGLCVSRPDWVLAQVLPHSGLRIVGFVEAGWDHHLDVVSLAKDAHRVLKRS